MKLSPPDVREAPDSSFAVMEKLVDVPAVVRVAGAAVDFEASVDSEEYPVSFQ
jgi:hypothetical protein